MFNNIKRLEKVAISIKSLNILNELLKENPRLKEIMLQAKTKTEALLNVKKWILEYFENHPNAYNYYKGKTKGRNEFKKLSWKDYAAIRLMEYLDNAGKKFHDLNLRGELVGSNPFKFIWMAIKYGTGGAKEDFFEDMLHLFRQFKGKSKINIPSKKQIELWMDRHPSGLDPKIIKIRKQNLERIINILIEKIDEGEIISPNFYFEANMSKEQKYMKMLQWWDDRKFHLRFAIRSPKLLNELLNFSLDPATMKLLEDAQNEGIPFFINPYYLSLLNVNEPYFAPGADLVIRDYVIYSKELIEEFGNLIAWEFEDIVKPGKPNVAGWILPSAHNVHRRYPEVAILIPDTIGRACGGLCVSCQRMFDFQSGNLNFNLERLKPKETWPQKLNLLLEYFEDDSQLRDILITGGDALMSTNQSLQKIFDAIYEMALKKIRANKNREDGKKYAEILRVRLGTRIPVYIPQRVTTELVEILSDFKKKSSAIGIKQFVIQTHFETAMEITPESKEAIQKLLSAGWIVTNQMIFTVAASRRGHTAKLRKVLNDIGVLTYYTFTVKGYRENYYNFATNERAVQEQIEEKYVGNIPQSAHKHIQQFTKDPENMVENINKIRNKNKIPFLSTDRNILNLPGIGKSMTFRTIGITRDGRRILCFEHDENRSHSPIIKKMKNVIVIESKSIAQYLRQIETLGEDINEYESIYGYSMGSTEKIHPIYQYPEYDFKLTKEITNFTMEEITEVEDDMF